MRRVTLLEERSFIRENYVALGPTFLSTILDIKYRTIRSIGNKAGLIAIRRRHKVNDKVFSRPLTLEACYWAGFLAADGCISPEKNAITIRLALIDKSHVIKLRKFLGYTGKITTYRILNGSVAMSVCSSRILKDLKENFSLGPRKTLTLTFPKNLTRKQSLAFIKGYIDGDGCIGIYKSSDKRYKYLLLHIVGTKNFLNSIKNIFEKKFKVKLGKPRKTLTKIHQWSVTYNKAVKILYYLNSLKTLELKRKWDVIKKNTFNRGQPVE